MDHISRYISRFFAAFCAVGMIMCCAGDAYASGKRIKEGNKTQQTSTNTAAPKSGKSGKSGKGGKGGKKDKQTTPNATTAAPQASSQKPNSQKSNYGDHAYVDLGLKVKWATMNIGASAPEEIGDYFQWGQIETRDETKNKLSATGDYYTGWGMKKDDSIAGDKQWDPAAHIWGGSWRMPTKEDFDELVKNCDVEIEGCYVVFTSKKNSKSVIFPISGYFNQYGNLDDDCDSSEPALYYWTASVDDPENNQSYCFEGPFGGADPYGNSTEQFYIGCPIRPVSK